jgi:two-component system, OmpR family, sensor kinase
MLFDDRLATVLRSPLGGEVAVRTQYRQLLDLLGSRGASPGDLTPERYRRLADRTAALAPGDRERIIDRPAFTGRNAALLAFLGWQRLEMLEARIPADERSRILREPGVRLRNPQLLAFLAQGEARPAAAAVATARLDEAEWLDLIPRLPVMARGFLRHRRDLPPAVRDQLASLGVGDLVLPQPEPGEASVQMESPAGNSGIPEGDGIRALLRRIEAFREGRRPPAGEARLPLGDLPAGHGDGLVPDRFDFLAGPDLRITWAEPDLAPLVVGMRLGSQAPGTLAVLDDRAFDALAMRLPVVSARLSIDAAPAVSGEWRIDAEPVFAPDTGQFAGYRGRLRRPDPDLPVEANTTATTPADSPGDRMRQALHELRTPVNAIQGFAEIIQQQIFGPAPNAYRALAAAIAVDAAKLLAAFEEIDRLARLETGALTLAEGNGDLREALVETVRRLDGVLRPRNAGIVLAVEGSPFTTAIAREELLVLAWRILGTLAGSLAPGETIPARLVGNGERISLHCGLPATIAATEDPFATIRPDRQPAISAGMFGSGFSLRLARAEVQSAGGTMEIAEGNMALTLPVLTDSGAAHSVPPDYGRMA